MSDYRWSKGDVFDYRGRVARLASPLLRDGPRWVAVAVWADDPSVPGRGDAPEGDYAGFFTAEQLNELDAVDLGEGTTDGE